MSSRFTSSHIHSPESNTHAGSALWRVLLVLMIAGLMAAPAYSQLTLSASYSSIDQLSVGDIDFKVSGSRNLFFTLSMTSDVPRNVRLSAEIRIELADGSTYSPAAHLVTRPFAINQQKIITNLDIGPDAEIKTEEFDFDGAAEDRIRDLALSTGRLPAGTYTFSLRISDVAVPLVTDEEEIVIVIQNVSRVDLLLPRDNDQVFTTFPSFQWFFDGDSVELSVYEMRSTHASREEAAQGVPQLSVILASSFSTFQYPSSSVRALEQGKSYVWKIRGLTQGVGGSGTDINSEIWKFTVNGSGGGQSSRFFNEQNVENMNSQIQLLYGTSQEFLNDLLNGDLVLTGVVLVDGQAYTAEEVQAVLQDLAANPDKIIEIKIID